MAFGSEAFIAFAAVVLLTTQSAELRHDHLWKSGAGTLQVTDNGVTWVEPEEPKHSRTWHWDDIQRLELTSNTIRVLTYEDAKWRGYRDREFLLKGLPAEFAQSLSPLLRGKLGEKFVGTLAVEPSDAIWRIAVKLRQGLGGSEGELIFAPGLLTYSSPEKAESRSWPLEQIEMVSSSGRYELTVLPHEQDGWTRGRREYNFQLKRPLGEHEYQQLWMSIQTANGLVSNATGRVQDSSNNGDKTMKKVLFTSAFAALSLFAADTKTFIGVITDSMCVKEHAHMNAGPDAECTKACVKSGNGKYKYVLFDGTNSYKLSDQETPEKFAAKRVKVTGTLFEKTGIIKVDKIEAAK